MVTQAQRHRHILMSLVVCGDDILQIHPGGVTAFLDHTQKLREIALPQSFHLHGHSGVVGVEVDTPQYCPVAALLAKLGNSRIEILFVDLSQHILAKVGTDGLHLLGNRSIFIG